MLTVTLPDEQWQKILPFRRSHPNIYVRRESECRNASRNHAVGSPVAAHNGDSCPKNTTLKHCLHQSFTGDATMEYVLTDSIFIRTYPCAASVLKRIMAVENTKH